MIQWFCITVLLYLNNTATSCNKMFQMLFHKVIHYAINLLVQRHALTFILCPKQQNSLSYNLSTLRTILSHKPKREFADGIHTGHNTPSWTTHVHWSSPWARVDNRITFLLDARFPDIWLSLTQLPANEPKRQLRVYYYPKNTQTLYLLKVSTTNSEITVNGSPGSSRLATMDFVFLGLSLMCRFKHQEFIAAKSLFCDSIIRGRESGPGIIA